MYVFCLIKGKAKKKRLNADAVIDGLEGSSNSASLSTVPSNTGSGKGKKELFFIFFNAC